MTVQAINVVIYIIGVLVSYPVSKWSYRMAANSWTIGDRTFILVVGFASWVCVLTAIVVWLVGLCVSDNRPAKW